MLMTIDSISWATMRLSMIIRLDLLRLIRRAWLLRLNFSFDISIFRSLQTRLLNTDLFITCLFFIYLFAEYIFWNTLPTTVKWEHDSVFAKNLQSIKKYIWFFCVSIFVSLCFYSNWKTAAKRKRETYCANCHLIVNNW